MLVKLLSGDTPRSFPLTLLLFAIFIGLALAPFLFPGTRSVDTAARICVFILLVASYDLLLGYAGIVSFAASATPARFGELAPKVTKAAQSEDPLALKLLQHGADHIARTLTDMGWTSPLPICLTGGLAPRYEPFLPHDMRSAIAPPKGEPIDGALSLAQDLRREMSA